MLSRSNCGLHIRRYRGFVHDEEYVLRLYVCVNDVAFMQVLKSFEDLDHYRFDDSDWQALVLVLYYQFVETTAEGLKHQTGVHPIDPGNCKVVEKANHSLRVRVLWVRIAYHLQYSDLVDGRLCVLTGALHHLQCDVFARPITEKTVNLDVTALRIYTYCMSRQSQTVEKWPKPSFLIT